MKSFAFLVVLCLVSTVARAENSVILSQKGPPLKITKYDATYEEEYRGSYSNHPDQIKHTVNYKNVSGKLIVAYQIGLVAFDVFNNFMDKFIGWSIEDVAADIESEGIWIQTPYAAFSFKRYGTAVTFVNAVRFSDGSIWRADIGEVLTELQKFEKDVKKEDLQEKKR